MRTKKIGSVLLIDDDEPTNFINRKILQNSNLVDNIYTVQSGRQAIRFLHGSGSAANTFPCPDLIFLDINMPAMDGWEFLAQYKQLTDVQKGNIIIVMLTTSLNVDDELKANEIAEINGFWKKPLTNQAITEIAERYF